MLDTTIDCACVIHGTAYEWEYVEKLYSMLSRNLSFPIRFHVFTEADREVPAHMIKHSLQPWAGIEGPRRAWWYKMQLFDPSQFQGRMLYFDLDVIITGNLDWIIGADSKYFWTVRDFKYLWRPESQTLNSSVMYWDTEKFPHIWRQFSSQDISKIVAKYKGDQDYLSDVIDYKNLRFLDSDRVQSWRWQVQDGGLDFTTRTYARPNSGAIMSPTARILVCHGKPKPHTIKDMCVVEHWK